MPRSFASDRRRDLDRRRAHGCRTASRGRPPWPSRSTWNEWLSPSRREQAVGVVRRRSAACPASDAGPDSSAGTASVVWLLTVVALRYQVASSRERGEVRVAGRVDPLAGVHQHVGVELVEHDDHDRGVGAHVRGGGLARCPAAGPAWRPASPTGTAPGRPAAPARAPSARPERPRARVGERDRRADQDHREPTSTALEPPNASSSSWSANAAARHADEDQVERRGGPPASRTTSASTRIEQPSAATRTIAIAKSRMSPRVLPRATKKSGESASTSNSGFANAKAHSTARCSHARCQLAARSFARSGGRGSRVRRLQGFH